MNRSFFVLGGLLLSGTVLAQSVLGSAIEVQGLVTVSNGTSLTNAVSGMLVVDGSRIVTSSGSSATVRLKNDCVLKMGPNQSLTVAADRTCDELLAQLQGSGVKGAAATPGGALGPLLAFSAMTAASLSYTGKNSPSSSGINPDGGGAIPVTPISQQ